MPTPESLLTSFPLLASPVAGGRQHWQTGNASVREVMLNILLTRPGERLMRPEFGAGIRSFIHHPNNETTRALIADAALRALLDARAEGRRELLEVLDAGAATGECLAAGPALAWHAALAVVARAGRATVVTADVDGALGVVALEAA